MPIKKSAKMDSAVLADEIRYAEARLLDWENPASSKEFQRVLEELTLPQASIIAAPSLEAALQLCQKLYLAGRPFEALPFARALAVQANFHDDLMAKRRATTACGLLLAETGDYVGALDFHAQSLRIANELGDCVETSRVWNNVGLALYLADQNELSMTAFTRAVGIVEGYVEPVYSRFSAYMNIAHNCYLLRHNAQGLEYASKALDELTPEFVRVYPHGAVLCSRNMVRLHIATGNVGKALEQVGHLNRLAAIADTNRSEIAAKTATAAYEIAAGDFDVGLTRLDSALTQARKVPGTLRDTLACVIQGEEKAGNYDRAMTRFQEFSDHVYRKSVAQALKHLEFSTTFADIPLRNSTIDAQAEARLRAGLSSPSPPAEWETLVRLARGADVKAGHPGVDFGKSALSHGQRVGIMVERLAIAAGEPILRALEIGLAAQIHDIGKTVFPPKQNALIGPRFSVAEPIARHCEAGAEILGDDTHSRMLIAKEMAKYHHAHWNGTGYPYGVSGKSIPHVARICAVANCYDGLASDPGDGTKDSLEASLLELHKLSGTVLDPELVLCFDRMVRSESVSHGIEYGQSSGSENFDLLISALSEERGFI